MKIPGNYLVPSDGYDSLHQSWFNLSPTLPYMVWCDILRKQKRNHLPRTHCPDIWCQSVKIITILRHITQPVSDLESTKSRNQSIFFSVAWSVTCGKRNISVYLSWSVRCFFPGVQRHYLFDLSSVI